MRFRLLKLSMLPLSWYRLPPRNSPGSQFSLQAQNTKRKSTPMECSFVGETSPGRRQAAYRQVRSALWVQCKKDIPWDVFFALEASPGIGPGNKGFADLCLTAWLRRLIITGTNFIHSYPCLERITGIEPATSTLARSRSTK